MSIKLPKEDRTEPPGWLQIAWKPDERIDSMQTIMACSPRDWSKHPHDGEVVDGAPDAEQWALYILINADGWGEAARMWKGFVEEHQGFRPTWRDTF